MKCWKPINCLAICCLSVLMLSCSTENTVVGSIGVSDVKSSGCKASASLMESRPDYYNHFIGQRSVLHLLLGKENTVTDLFHVGASSSEGKIVLILYPDKDMMTNCICRYDVDFKINNIPSGNYQLEVYHTTADKQINKDNQIFSGTVNLEKGKELILTMSR